ncbi:MAG: CRISPR-associated endonuclease Cas1, partial [Verrucomicrobiota bacterium]
YQPRDEWRKWLFTTAELFPAMIRRWEKLFGITLPRFEMDWADAELLPYFWEYEKHRHQPKSSAGCVFLNGNVGPLYLRGPVARLWPLLLLGSELHVGLEMPAAQGCYRILLDRKFFDVSLVATASYEAALDRLNERSDLVDELAQSLDDRATILAKLAGEVRDGTWQPAPARSFIVKKSTGEGSRTISLLAARDHLAHKVLLETLAPVLDRAFEQASFGYRPGRSSHDVRAAIERAAAEGCGYVVESDIEDFFAQVNWEILLARLDRHVPMADVVTRRLLQQCIEHPAVLNGEPVIRTSGLLQGSPLSPLLSNVYLDHFDEQMEARGFRLVRYADDFLVLARTTEECQQALTAVREILASLKLSVKAEKTSITVFDAGFSFVGLQFGQGLDAGMLSRAALKKTLFLRHEFAFVGVDHDALVVRKADTLVARLPLRRVGELILLGASGVSTRLVEKCDWLDIPITFCTPAGKFISTIAGSDRGHYEMAFRHAQRRQGLAEPDVVAITRRLVTAKLSHYGVWLRDAHNAEADTALAAIDQSLRGLAEAINVETVRGWEGHAAAATFVCLNQRVSGAAFVSSKRQPHEQRDRWNSLLDFAYSMLFARLNTLLRTRGLCPFLGFLHSPLNRFESLVCDLQEPFRSRMDRLVTKLVNLHSIQENDFEMVADGRFFLQSAAVARFLEAFEQEMKTRLRNEP